MIIPKFEVEQTYLPITMEQFESLTNEMLVEINKLCDPHFLNGDSMAGTVMSAIHAMDHKIGVINKIELFDACVNRLSNHITYYAVEAIKARLQKEADNKKALGEEAPLTIVPDLETVQ